MWHGIQGMKKEHHYYITTAKMSWLNHVTLWIVSFRFGERPSFHPVWSSQQQHHNQLTPSATTLVSLSTPSQQCSVNPSSAQRSRDRWPSYLPLDPHTQFPTLLWPISRRDGRPCHRKSRPIYGWHWEIEWRPIGPSWRCRRRKLVGDDYFPGIHGVMGEM